MSDKKSNPQAPTSSQDLTTYKIKDRIKTLKARIIHLRDVDKYLIDNFSKRKETIAETLHKERQLSIEFSCGYSEQLEKIKEEELYSEELQKIRNENIKELSAILNSNIKKIKHVKKKVLFYK